MSRANARMRRRSSHADDEASAESAMDGILALRVGAIWKGFREQPLAFWILCLYFAFEYVRPQALYPAIDVLPWAQLALIASFIAAMLSKSSRLAKTPILPMFMIFCVVVVLSGIFAYSPAMSWQARDSLLGWIIVFFAATSIINSEKRFVLLILAYCVFNIKMSQHGMVVWAERGFSFAGYGINGAPGWFHNSGEYAIQMLVFGSLAFGVLLPLVRRLSGLRKWVAIAIAVSGYMAVMGASSRGSQFALAVVAIWWILHMRWGLKALIGTAALCTLLWAVLPDEQLERIREVGTDASSLQRLAYWDYAVDKVIPDNPVLGVGYANWLTYVRDKVPEGMGPYGVVQESHNIFIQLTSESGFVGLAAFLLLLVVTLRTNMKARRIAERLGKPHLVGISYGLEAGIIGYLVAGQFVTVFYYPYFWIHMTFIAALYGIVNSMREEPVPPGADARRGLHGDQQEKQKDDGKAAAHTVRHRPHQRVIR